MDVNLASAAILGATVLGLVSLAKTLLDGPNRARIVAVLTVAVGIVVALLVGASDFAATQVVLDRPLDTLNGWSQVLLGLLIGGFASGGWQTLKSVRNIGANHDA